MLLGYFLLSLSLCGLNLFWRLLFPFRNKIPSSRPVFLESALLSQYRTHLSTHILNMSLTWLFCTPQSFSVSELCIIVWFWTQHWTWPSTSTSFSHAVPHIQPPSSINSTILLSHGFNASCLSHCCYFSWCPVSLSCVR